MSAPRYRRSSGFPGAAPKAVRIARDELVEHDFLDGGGEQLPLVLRPRVDGLDAAAWASGERDAVNGHLMQWGAILFRDFAITSDGEFDRFANALCPALLDYRERAAPRSEVRPGVYTSTEFPADQAIPMHHEMSYSHNWPTKLLFYCEQPARERGATPIADDRKVFARLDEAIKRRFVERKVMYVRSYGPGLDTWQETFQTEDRNEVERYCAAAGADCLWGDGEALRTRSVRRAVIRHPLTGESVWFNHAVLFHSSNMPTEIREALLADHTPDELPRNVFYGDGSPIEASVLDEIRGVYEECAVTFAWEPGDVLLLDNVLAIHGREPFVGPRKVLVAMAELYTDRGGADGA
jgi:alpha-ketoglutarate-dependent taurine dioxygenase